MANDDKKYQKYQCEKCDYNTSYKCNWEKHLETRKYKMMTNDDK